MAYQKTNWQNDVTPLSAKNLNKLETQYDEAKTELGTAGGDIAVDGNNLKNDTVKTAKLVNKPVIGIAAANLLDPSRMVFSRASEAYRKDGSKVGINVPRLEQGKFGQGVFIEESTANLLTANQSSVETDTTGFNATAGATLSRDTTEHWHGSASLKIVCDGTSTNQGFYVSTSTNAAQSTTYTASIYLKGTGTVNVDFYHNPNVSPIATQTVSLTDSWQRVILTGTTRTEDYPLRIYVRTDSAQAITFYADGLQIEQKPYVTSFTDGTRQYEQLYYDLPQELPDEWFAVGWFKPEWDAALTDSSGGYPKLINFDDGTTNNRHTLMFITNSASENKTKFVFNKAIAGTATYLYSDAQTFSADDKIFYTIAQLTQPYGDLSAGMHLWVGINDGDLQHFSNTDTSTVSGITKAYIGCYTSAGYEANGTLDFPLVVPRAPRDSEEIEALFRASDWGGVRNYPVPGVIPDDTKTTSGNTVWHDGNTGSGSGKSVDMVDGKHASDIAVPVGAVLWFAAPTAPSGFLVCNGAAVSRTAYADLFAVIGTTFGAGDGSTTFNLPDLRGEFIRGYDDSRGVDSGRTFGTSQNPTAIGKGDYIITTIKDGENAYSGSVTDVGSASFYGDTGTFYEVRPRNVALLPCIKY